MSERERIGFIGLGRMGLPMVRRLIGAGYLATVMDANPAAVVTAQQAGAQPAKTPKDVADAAEIVLVSLPTPDVVAAVATGPDGVREGRSVRTYIDLSTTGPAAAEQVASALDMNGIAVLDAPVSGGVGGAIAGTLTIMAAGPENVFHAAMPVLDTLGDKVLLIGSRPGQGQLLKLLNNMLSAAALAVTSEAMVLAAKAGLDAATVLDVLNASSGRNTATSDKFPRYVLARTFDYGFTLGLMAKDVALYSAEARRQGVPSWIGRAVDGLWAHAVAQGLADADATAIVQLIEQWAGAEVRQTAAATEATRGA